MTKALATSALLLLLHVLPYYVAHMCRPYTACEPRRSLFSVPIHVHVVFVKTLISFSLL